MEKTDFSKSQSNETATIDVHVLPTAMRQSISYQDFDFEMDKGHERISDITNDSNKMDIPTFHGYCYFCDYSKHSQNYCPLRYCYFCNTYGHSVKVCSKNSANGSADWRSKTTFRVQIGLEDNTIDIPLLETCHADYNPYINDRFIRKNNHFKHWKRNANDTSAKKNNFEKIKIQFGSTWRHNNVTLKKSIDFQTDWRKSMKKTFNCDVLVELE
jgi:hypothetical protein